MIRPNTSKNKTNKRGEEKKMEKKNSQLQIYHYCQIVTAFKMNKDWFLSSDGTNIEWYTWGLYGSIH